MKFAELSASALQTIKAYKWDSIVGKHEGPWDYGGLLDVPDSELAFVREFGAFELEFINIHGFDVLLPVERQHHQNITILRCIESADGNTLTIFLKDTTYLEDSQEEFSEAGFMAVCDKCPNENFYIAIVYHEWFMVDNSQVRI